MTSINEMEERIVRVRLIVKVETDNIVSLLALIILTSDLSEQQKRFVLNHTQHLVKRFLLHVGDTVPNEINPFSYLRSLGIL